MTHATYDTRRFGTGLGVSFAILAAIVLVVLSTGIVYAVPLASIGGFTIHVDKLTAESTVIYPGVGDTSNQAAYPMAIIEQKDVTIEGLKLIKEFSVDSIPGLSGNARIVMSASGTVTAEQQFIKVSRLSAESAVFNQQVIDESPGDSIRESFIITSGDASESLNKLQDGRIVEIRNKGPAQVLTDADIQAHYLASSSISLPGLSLEVQYDPDGDGTYNEGQSSDVNDGKSIRAGDSAHTGDADSTSANENNARAAGDGTGGHTPTASTDGHSSTQSSHSSPVQEVLTTVEDMCNGVIESIRDAL